MTVDTEGYWYGNRDFRYNRELYVYRAQIQRTFHEYQNMVAGIFFDILIPAGAFMRNHNLGINLLLLSTYQTTFNEGDNDVNTDVFLFTPTPSEIFNSGVYTASVGTIDSVCELLPSIEFDRANSKFNIAYEHQQFANSSACFNAVDPYHLGYDPAWSGEEFDIAIGELHFF